MDKPSELETIGIGPIVSSSHLATGAMPAMSEMEYALIVASNAFSRWMVRCMGAAGLDGLTHLEVLVLHSSNHRDREKTLGDLCVMLNIEDTHLVSYAIKKLVTMELVTTGKRGKEKTVIISPKGVDACARYKEVREALLISSVRSMGLNDDDVSRVAGLLRAISGQYDQASRGAASL
ncbi:MAG: winged helix DNA-binding protein [Pseudomonadota bacterium]